MEFPKILGLFVAIAVAEIVGCYLPYLRPIATDLVGAAICVAGMGVIMLGPRYA